MLETKLEKASQEAKRKRTQFAISLFTIVVLVSLWLSGVIKVDLSILGLTQETKKQISLSAAKNNSVQTSKDPAIEERSKQPAQNNVSTLALDQKRSLVPNDSSSANKERDAFKELLLEFENSVEPVVLSKGFENWNFEEQQNIITKKSDSILAFSLGNYEQALEKLKMANQYSGIQVAKFDSDFIASLSKASKHYEADDFNASFLNISNALRLKPQSVKAQELKIKISLLPTVLENIQKAAVARTENNIELEVKYLKKVIDTDPSRFKHIDRLEVVNKEILELKFAKLIKEGLVSVDKKNLKAARRYLKEAESIFKERSEKELLLKKVKALELEFQVRSLLNKAKIESQADNWPIAEILYQEARKLQPNRKDLENFHSKAEKINILRRKLEFHLQAPAHRLSSSNVAEIVRTLTDEAMTLSSESFSLADQTTKLLDLLRAYSTKVQVRVISNGVTNISVRGVGRVGFIKEKVIDLKPGTYTFEGKRTGHRSKLIQVDVPPNSNSIEVKIFSDERI